MMTAANLIKSISILCDQCLFCGSYLVHKAGFCAICEEKLLKDFRPQIDAVKIKERVIKICSLFPWSQDQNFRLNALLMAIKGGRKKYFLNWYSQKLYESFKIPTNATLVPVPGIMNQKDHAWQLSDQLSRISGASRCEALVRQVRRGPQKEKSFAERHALRFENPEKFTCSGPLILVDDVVTSGATAYAGAEALGFPENFHVYCVARRGKVAPAQAP